MQQFKRWCIPSKVQSTLLDDTCIVIEVFVGASKYLDTSPIRYVHSIKKKVLITSSNSYVATSCWGCIAFKKQLQLGREEGFIQRMTAPMQLCSTQTKYIYTHICYVTADRAAFDIPRRRRQSTTALLLPTSPASGFLYASLVAMYSTWDFESKQVFENSLHDILSWESWQCLIKCYYCCYCSYYIVGLCISNLWLVWYITSSSSYCPIIIFLSSRNSAALKKQILIDGSTKDIQAQVAKAAQFEHFVYT